MTIDYDQLKTLVKEAMFTAGGINEPSAPEGIPIRMPAADTADREPEMGDPEANEMYAIAVAARGATEELIEALDDPVFDDAYEHAFKASACLRRALNSIEETGAHPMPDERVVTPPAKQQKYAGYVPYGGEGSFAYADGQMQEALGDEVAPAPTALGTRALAVTQKAGLGGSQAPEQIVAMLEAVVTGGGIPQQHLKRGISAWLASYGVSTARAIGQVMADEIEKKRKQKELEGS
jgi:hypothetical protein